ncbi:MAG: aminotransferase class I/II-fold pyridoxal phosphate-dependent enzyme [Gammaproteobacteria bacterium]|nr:aminotransferase class I/II-fold pyridoxal phosphate-dependent enzyme [Gammaproteobacteria bacterium]
MVEADVGSRKKKERLIREVVKTFSKYSEDELIPSALLQEDLGIDSIMIAAIAAELNKMFTVPQPVTTQGVETLNMLIEKFGKYELGEEAWYRWFPSSAVRQSDNDVDSAVTVPADYDRLTIRDFVGDGGADLFAKVERFAPFLKDRTSQGLFWYGMAAKDRSANRAVIFDEHAGQEREFLMFASNNYLDLANDPRVIQAIGDAAKKFGATHTGSRLIGGTSALHKELEAKLAALKGRDDCIVFPSGYSANVGVLSALLGPNDVVISDVYNHMSIQDGAKLAGAARRIYSHNDMDSLEQVLQRAADRPGGKLIVADGVFSMHGDIAKLPDMIRLAKQYNARLLIDDAHATGVLGERGSGTAEHFGLKGAVDLEVGTLSKALAGMGGFVVGNRDVIDYLRFYANAYVFAAAIPAHVAAGLITSIEILQQEPERIEKLWSNIRYLRTALQQQGFDTEQSDSAIIPVAIGDEQKAMTFGRAVRRRGLFCQTVVFPGVAVGEARLRISVLTSHTREDLDQAVDILIEVACETRLLEVN